MTYSIDPKQMNGQPCVRGMRLKVRRIPGIIASIQIGRELFRRVSTGDHVLRYRELGNLNAQLRNSPWTRGRSQRGLFPLTDPAELSTGTLKVAHMVAMLKQLNTTIQEYDNRIEM